MAETRPETPAATRAAEFRALLTEQRQAIVADGAMATMLFSKGILTSRCVDELNLSLPALVRDVHRAHLAAGARILGTNTFGANRMRLAGYGLGGRVRLINRAGVRIARAASNGKAFVAGVMGPLGTPAPPAARLDRDTATAVFSEQASALFGAGVDLFLLETFQSLEELQLAVEAVRAAAETTVIVAQVAVGPGGAIGDGTRLDALGAALDQLPADVVGLNCTAPAAAVAAIEHIARATAKPLSASPSAGIPTIGPNGLEFPCSPEYLAAQARRLVELGVRIAGGCCGATPDHVRAIAAAVDGMEPGERATSGAPPALRSETGGLKPVTAKQGLAAALETGEFVKLIELAAPAGADLAGQTKDAKAAKKAGVHAILIPSATAGLTQQAACELIAKAAKIDVLYQLGETAGAAALQSELLTADALGLHNLLATSDATGWLAVAGRLNRGLDFGGYPLGGQTSLTLGVLFDPASTDREAEVRRLAEAEAAGADFALTTPLFDATILEQFLGDAGSSLKLPIVSSVQLLAGAGHADYLANELGMSIPAALLERLRSAPTPKKALSEGIAIAEELAGQLRHFAAGIRVIAPQASIKQALAIAAATGERAAGASLSPLLSESETLH